MLINYEGEVCIKATALEAERGIDVCKELKGHFRDSVLQEIKDKFKVSLKESGDKYKLKSSFYLLSEEDVSNLMLLLVHRPKQIATAKKIISESYSPSIAEFFESKYRIVYSLDHEVVQRTSGSLCLAGAFEFIKDVIIAGREIKVVNIYVERVPVEGGRVSSLKEEGEVLEIDRVSAMGSTLEDANKNLAEALINVGKNLLDSSKE